MDLVVSSYMAKIEIEPVNERMSKVLKLSINEAVISKGNYVLNNLIDQYNADGISDKDEIAQTTIDFLDLRIGLLSNEFRPLKKLPSNFVQEIEWLMALRALTYFYNHHLPMNLN